MPKPVPVTPQFVANLHYHPEPLGFYKPMGPGKGKAMKVQYRYKALENDKGFIEDVEGGLFLQIAPEVGKNDGNFATFGWDQAKNPTTVIAKLGLADVQGMAAAREHYRRFYKLPASLKKKQKVEGKWVPVDGEIWGTYHKSGSGGLAIELLFAVESLTITVSRSAQQRQSIQLTLAEEWSFFRYLERAVDRMMDVGER